MEMPEPSDPLTRCGIDTVEIARIERLLRETPADDLGKLFSIGELDECVGAGRAASLAARFAAKEACARAVWPGPSRGSTKVVSG